MTPPLKSAKGEQLVSLNQVIHLIDEFRRSGPNTAADRKKFFALVNLLEDRLEIGEPEPDDPNFDDLINDYFGKCDPATAAQIRTDLDHCLGALKNELKAYVDARPPQTRDIFEVMIGMRAIQLLGSNIDIVLDRLLANECTA